MKRKVLYIFIPIIALCVFFYFYNSASKQNLAYEKCPDDYTSDDAGTAEKMADIERWSSDFYKTHPGAALSDWSTARYQFWVNNGCVEALQRYKEAKDGKADPATMEVINEAIKDAVGTSTQ
ncbi:MAG: hypothetical protein EXS47_01575 [Candidatus Zambryskibacteria bacterium]|nr:hypothetical protein [Candidatus Zambryskibacteria bacterium]